MYVEKESRLRDVCRGVCSRYMREKGDLCFYTQVNACKHACPLHACMGLDIMDVFKGEMDKSRKDCKNIIECFL